MPKFKVSHLVYLAALVLIFVPLYPKFPLIGVSGTFVSIRLEDFVVSLVFALVVLTRLRSSRPDLFSPPSRSVMLYLFIGSVSLFSAIFLTKTADPKLGLLHYLRRIEYFGMYYVGYFCLTRLSQLGFIVRTILVTALLVALYGLGQQFWGFPVISTTNSEFAKGLAVSLGPAARINSTFAGHYDLAAFSLFPLTLILGLLALPIRHKWILFAIGALIYWTMLLSASRVTFAAFFATAFLFSWAIRRRVWLIPLSILAAVSILLTPQLLGRYREFVVNHLFTLAPAASAQSPAVDEQIPDALKPSAVPEDRSLNIRLKAEWPRAFRAFLKNPVLGTGFSSVGLAVDNDYLRILAETGLLGLAAFSLIILRIAKTTWSIIRSPSYTLPHIFILSASFGLFGLLLNAVFIDVFEASKIAIFTWTVVGLSERTKLLHHVQKD